MEFIISGNTSSLFCTSDMACEVCFSESTFSSPGFDVTSKSLGVSSKLGKRTLDGPGNVAV